MGRTVVGRILAASKHQECQVEREEEQEEHDGRTKRAEQENGREDEPARQEEADCAVGHLGIGAGGRERGGVVWAALAQDVPVGSQENAVGDPEATIRGQSSSTEGVANSHFPRKLNKHVNRDGPARLNAYSLTTYQRGAGPDRRSPERGGRRC